MWSGVFVISFLLAVTNGGVNKTLARFRRLPDASSRIVNGYPAEQGEFPSQVSLQVFGNHACGASILNERWALTAAHCVVQRLVCQLSLLSGTTDLTSHGTIHPVSQIVLHNDFNWGPVVVSDIAVLKVSLPFVLDGIILKPITLPEMDQPTAAEDVATAIGWGMVSKCLPPPEHLQKVDIEILDQEDCSKMYGVTPSQICAYAEDPKGICDGDSGGPLFVDNVVVGIASYVMGDCAQPFVPAVFTRVASYVRWIADVTGCLN